MIKYLEIEKYPGEINTECSYIKEAEGVLALRGGGSMKTVQREMGNTGLKDWSDQATSQGTLAATRSWKRQEMGSAPRASTGSAARPTP